MKTISILLLATMMLGSCGSDRVPLNSSSTDDTTYMSTDTAFNLGDTITNDSFPE